MALRLCADRLLIISMRQIRLLSSHRQFRSFSSSVNLNDQFKVCSQCIAPFECSYHKRCKYPDDDNVLYDIAYYTMQPTRNDSLSNMPKCNTYYDFGVDE